MTHIARMLDSHPRPEAAIDQAALRECIEACFACAHSCSSCADACLAEAHLSHLVRCIRLNLDCADVCQATGSVLLRQTETDWAIVRAQLQACATACRACGAECQRHADDMGMQHCVLCAESCRQCADACDRLLAVLPA